MNQTLTWLSGCRCAPRASPTAARPRTASLSTRRRLLADRAVDALLWVASFAAGTAAAPKTGVARHRARSSRAWPPPVRQAPGPTVFIPGIDAGHRLGGHLFRADGDVVSPLAPVYADTLPTVAERRSKPCSPPSGGDRMSTSRLLGGGVVFDPANGIERRARDIYVRDGRIVELRPDERAGRHEYDASGMVVMAGGIDMHSHIGGGKINLARLLMPEDHRACAPATAAGNPLELRILRRVHARHARHRLPLRRDGLHGRIRARDDRVERAPYAPGNGRHADHRSRRLRDARQRRTVPAACSRKATDFERIRDYIGWTINATKALGVKVVNPGGISAFKFNQRSLDVDEAHVHYDITPRQVLQRARAVADRTRRAASAAHSCEQPGRAGQHRIDARHDRCARRPARSPHAHPVPQLRQRRAAQVFFGGARVSRMRSTRIRTSRSTSARSCSARP